MGWTGDEKEEGMVLAHVIGKRIAEHIKQTIVTTVHDTQANKMREEWISNAERTCLT